MPSIEVHCFGKHLIGLDRISVIVKIIKLLPKNIEFK